MTTSSGLTWPTQRARRFDGTPQNARKHFQQKGVALRANWLDKFSSAEFFDGWNATAAKEAATLRELWRSAGIRESKPTRNASTWLLRVGWRRLGMIQPTDVPAS